MAGPKMDLFLMGGHSPGKVIMSSRMGWSDMESLFYTHLGLIDGSIIDFRRTYQLLDLLHALLCFVLSLSVEFAEFLFHSAMFVILRKQRIHSTDG